MPGTVLVASVTGEIDIFKWKIICISIIILMFYYTTVTFILVASVTGEIDIFKWKICISIIILMFYDTTVTFICNQC